MFHHIQCDTSDNCEYGLYSNVFLHRQFHVIKVIYVIKVKY